MIRPIISIHDENGNETQRAMNDDEFAQFSIDYEKAKAKEIADKNIEAAKEAAQAKLAAIGLTTEDLKALGL